MATANQWMQIFERIGDPAAVEMLAEEAAELSAKASKLARILRAENPSRTTLADAFGEMKEELADVLNAAAVLDVGWNGSLSNDRSDIQAKKMTRWYESLF